MTTATVKKMKKKKKSSEYTGDGARAVVKRLRELLATGDPVNFLTTIRESLNEHALPYARVTKSGTLKCPFCGQAVDDSFQYFEDIGSRRYVLRQKEKLVVIEGFYKTEGFDKASAAERLYCGCGTEFVLPDDYETDFV